MTIKLSDFTNIKDWLIILLGCVIQAAGFVFFINPYNIVPGGVYGLSIVLHNLMPSWQIGTISYAFEIPLEIISILLLGGKLGGRTIVAALITPLIMNFISLISYPDAASLEALDPTKILGGNLNLSEHLMLSTIVGGAVIGAGIGLVARTQAMGGGTDIVAMLMQKYMRIRFSRALLIVDGLVVLFGLIIIGLGVGSSTPTTHNSALLSLYSLIAIYVCSNTISLVINGMKEEKIIFIIGNHSMDELRSYILHDLDRGATAIKSSGIYSGEDKDMLFLVVTQKEVMRIKQRIKQLEPDAFIVITDAYNIYGEGFRALPNAGDIIPE
ncbi:MAG: YitT family protein [Prevotellaceae bacterium]|nr:YitT family protein [Prevotellaceae bacterium]